MLSCVIVAQPGLGATMQKTWLRIGGALLATLLALLLIAQQRRQQGFQGEMQISGIAPGIRQQQR
jgi:hypothetical protein